MPSLFSTNMMPTKLYETAGIDVNHDPDVKSDFVTPWVETFFDSAKNYATKFGLNHINFDILDKNLSPQLYKGAGFLTLESIVPTSQADIENFPAGSIILKPTIGMATKVLETFPVSQLAYCVISKNTLLSVIQMDPGFYERQQTGAVKYIIQEAIVTSNDIYEWVNIAGAVNGVGELVLQPSTRGDRYVKNRVVDGTFSCSNENDSPELLECKQYFANLVKNINLKNAIFSFQLLKHSSGNLAPIDFGYRLPYHIRYNLQDPTVEQYAVDLIRFAYDISPIKPEFNTVTAISVKHNGKGWPIIVGATGSTKAEALGKL